MREILFRGQVLETTEFECGENVVKGDFVEGMLVTDGNNAWIVGSVIEACEEYIALEYWYPVDPETVGEFTGYSDVAETKTFEHDIIKSRDYTWIVVFKNGCFRCCQIGNESKERNIGYLAVFGIKVIGNIFDNPELLEATP